MLAYYPDNFVSPCRKTLTRWVRVYSLYGCARTYSVSRTEKRTSELFSATLTPGRENRAETSTFLLWEGMRGFQNSTAYPPQLNSAGLSAINLAVLKVFGFGLGTGSAILLVPPPNLLKWWRKGRWIDGCWGHTGHLIVGGRLFARPGFSKVFLREDTHLVSYLLAL